MAHLHLCLRDRAKSAREVVHPAEERREGAAHLLLGLDGDGLEQVSSDALCLLQVPVELPVALRLVALLLDARILQVLEQAVEPEGS